MALVLDPVTGALVQENELENKKKQRENITDLNKTNYDETNISLDPVEDDNEVSGATAFVFRYRIGFNKST